MSTQPEFGIIPGWDKADRLRKARELTGLNQSAFAREIDVAPNTVSNAERGTVEIRRVTLRAWSLRTGVNFKWLETGEAPTDNDEGFPSELPRLDSNQQPLD